MNEQLTAVIAANRARQQRARELNARSGEQTFPVLTREELVAWVQKQLDGATSVATIKDVECLRLPELDKELIELVVRENPDSIDILGQTCPVEYREGAAPRIHVDFRGEQRMDWQKLPVVVRLPSGREVELYSYIDWSNQSYCVHEKSSAFGRRVGEYLNMAQWDHWSKPAIAVPDVTADGATIPEITTAQYGACVTNGTPLMAHGTLVVNSSYYYATDPRFKSAWFRNREEAEAARATAVAQLEKIRVEERERRELETAKAVASTLKTRLEELYRVLQGDDAADRGLQQAVYSRRYYDYVPENLEGVRQWSAETEELVAKAAAATVESENRSARRAQIEDAVRQYGYGQAHVLMADGLAYVNCGKANKLGSFEVDPRGAAGSRQPRPESLDAEYKNRVWQIIPVGQRIQCRDYSSRGNLNSDVSFTVPRGLSNGVWAVGEDDNGKFFFRTIYFENGREVVPERMEVVREPKATEDVRTATAKADLFAKWGSGNRTPPKTSRHR